MIALFDVELIILCLECNSIEFFCYYTGLKKIPADAGWIFEFEGPPSAGGE
jgi:hypothetical protein